LAQTLYGLKGSGEQLARGLTFLQKNLPSEFWVAQLSTDFRSDPDLRIARGEERPILQVAGKAREGTSSLSNLYEGFIAAVRQRLPRADMLKERLSSSGSKFTIDVSLFVPPENELPSGAQAAGGAAATGETKKSVSGNKPKAAGDSKPGDKKAPQ
jgi:hypothetical protein